MRLSWYISMVMASTSTGLVARQIWVQPTPTTGTIPPTCTPRRLSSGGQINIGQDTIITLTQDAAYQPACGVTPVPPPVDPLQPGVDLSVLDAKNPWYSSTVPQMYATSACTIVSYMLVIILFITPRTYFVGGTGGGSGFLGQGGVISGTFGSSPVIGIGSRPRLQKIAAMGVAVSLTIVSADSFKWAHRQYDAGYEDADELTTHVINGLEVRVVRTISESFLWLAQAQTLIRLFPRHKEKLMIKWIAFVLILLELLFSCLNHFHVGKLVTLSEQTKTALPTMNYLFALGLNCAYGSFVIVYAFQKRRFAFYHPYMRSMPLVALLSLTAVLIPVVFFVLDLSRPDVDGWGSYVQWVSSAAASVIVWEWVERIEALERDEKKGGILGREVFDGDELLDSTQNTNATWPSSRNSGTKSGRHNSVSGFGLSTGRRRKVAQYLLMGRSRQTRPPDSQTVSTSEGRDRPENAAEVPVNDGLLSPLPLPVAASLGRINTTSARRTVCESLHRALSDQNSPVQMAVDDSAQPQTLPELGRGLRSKEPKTPQEASQTLNSMGRKALLNGLQRISNPLRRQRETPPPEVARAIARHPQEPETLQAQGCKHISMLTRLHLKRIPKPDGPPRPPIVVPAPRRKRSWDEVSCEGNDNEDNDENSIEYNQSNFEGASSSRDANLPPDAVLNAMTNSCSVSPLSDHPPWNVH